MTDLKAVVIHRAYSVWEVWGAGSFGARSAYGREILHGTFQHQLDAERFADMLNMDDNIPKEGS